jgi:hypothetical protein
MSTIAAYAQLNARIMPIERGERFEDPLGDALAENGLGEVTGGGTLQSETGELDYCGIDVDLVDSAKAVPFVCEFLTKCGAPKGSKLQYEVDGQSVEVPFGAVEGLAIYLNGTDLPEKVYKECDVNVAYAEINRLLGDGGSIQGHWQGPSETALYLYGNSADEMRARIDRYLNEYPLCQRARVVKIA